MLRNLLISALSAACLIGPAHAYDFQDAHDYCEQHPRAIRPGESVNLCADRIIAAHASKAAHAVTCTEDMAALYPRECTLRVEMRPVQCILFAEGDFVTIRGQVVKSRQVEEEEGEPPHDYYEIILEKPLCERAADSAWPMFYTQVVNVKPKMLGHWVEVSGTMEGVEAGYNIDQKSIREVRD